MKMLNKIGKQREKKIRLNKCFEATDREKKSHVPSKKA